MCLLVDWWPKCKGKMLNYLIISWTVIFRVMMRMCRTKKQGHADYRHCFENAFKIRKQASLSLSFWCPSHMESTFKKHKNIYVVEINLLQCSWNIIHTLQEQYHQFVSCEKKNDITGCLFLTKFFFVWWRELETNGTSKKCTVSHCVVLRPVSILYQYCTSTA
jgi:hypothetical protein